MEKAEAVTERTLNILVFGMEKNKLTAPVAPIKKRNFTIFFESYASHRRLQEFDGVIVFQGIFEEFKSVSDYTGAYLTHRYDRDELDKRKKEVALLLEKGGFICFLLTDRFIDRAEHTDTSATDLSKYCLNHSDFYRKSFSNRMTSVTPVASELKRFVEMHSAAWTYFENFNDSLGIRVLARAGDRSVGISIRNRIYFLPALIPSARPEVVTEYFEHLVDGLTAIHNKSHQTLPDWIASYQFEEEGGLREEREAALQKIGEVEARLDDLARFKASLFHTGDALVADVGLVLEKLLGLKTDLKDEFKEDVKLLNGEGKVVAVGEIKGVNAGINREHINQADSHRERSGFAEGFPTLLIANTGIKSARSISEKLKSVPANEQIKHAVYMRVLILRTIDLLDLLRLVLAGKLAKPAALNLVLSEVGWITVDGDKVTVKNGN